MFDKLDLFCNGDTETLKKLNIIKEVDPDLCNRCLKSFKSSNDSGFLRNMYSELSNKISNMPPNEAKKKLIGPFLDMVASNKKPNYYILIEKFMNTFGEDYFKSNLATHYENSLDLNARQKACVE